LLDWLDGLDRLFLIDACQGLVPPGQFMHINWPGDEWRRVRGSGSHDYSVSQTFELAARLDNLPRQCRLWCAPGSQFNAETTLSPALLAQVPKVVDDLLVALTK
jgi:hydrogenase maturation protease